MEQYFRKVTANITKQFSINYKTKTAMIYYIVSHRTRDIKVPKMVNTFKLKFEKKLLFFFLEFGTIQDWDYTT